MATEFEMETELKRHPPASPIAQSGLMETVFAKTMAELLRPQAEKLILDAIANISEEEKTKLRTVATEQMAELIQGLVRNYGAGSRISQNVQDLIDRVIEEGFTAAGMAEKIQQEVNVACRSLGERVREAVGVRLHRMIDMTLDKVKVWKDTVEILGHR